MAGRTPISFEWNRRAETAIAHGALTNSKRPSCFVKGVYPTHLTKGQGAYVWDTSGNQYVDFVCGLGSNLLGYAQDEVNQAISRQAQKGATLSLGTPLEVETAEKVKEWFPFLDKVRFLKTGTDACAAAVRIARAHTGKKWIISHGYHGWAENFVSLSPPALGCMDADALGIRSMEEPLDVNERDNIAAVIVEPILTQDTPQRREYLGTLRQFCDRIGALLIFDEVITGFRTPKGSVSRYYGVEPDLVCMGKAMGNGMPISAVGGRKGVMDCGEWFVSSTFAGETLSLAASHATMTLLQTKFKLEDLWARGGEFLTRFNSFWPEGVSIEGYPTRGVFRADPVTKALFFQEACKAGILVGPSWFFNFAHIPLMDMSLSTFKDILGRIKAGSIRLEGEMPVSPFAQRMREEKKDE